MGEEGYAQLAARPDDAVAKLKKQWGLEDALGLQFARYLVNIATGDWGWSYHYGRSVSQLIAQNLRWTLFLLVPALVVGTLLGGWTGALFAWRSRLKNRFFPDPSLWSSACMPCQPIVSGCSFLYFRRIGIGCRPSVSAAVNFFNNWPV